MTRPDDDRAAYVETARLVANRHPDIAKLFLTLADLSQHNRRKVAEFAFSLSAFTE